MNDLPDLGQLRTFLAIVDRKGFGLAARFLNVSQPSVSQQIRRLEQRLGHQLFSSTSQPVRLTSDGEALVIFARALFAVAEKVRRYFSQSRLTGSLRLGLNEDFARTALPSVLNLFSRSYPSFQIETDCNTDTMQLFRELDGDKLDIVVGKCLPGQGRGDLLWQEPLVWVARSDQPVPIEDPVPLAVPPSPSEMREVILKALDDAHRTWRVRFQSQNLLSVEAAVAAGIGICAFGRSFHPQTLIEVDGSAGLPPLPDLTFYIDQRPEPRSPGADAFGALLRETVLLMKQPLEGKDSADVPAQ